MRTSGSWLLFGLAVVQAQNVGIGTVAPSEKLHVAGNLRFDGALMPNGVHGNPGQFLVSQGANLPPVWQSIRMEAAYTSTTVELLSSGTVADVVILPTLTLLQGQRVLLWASGHARNWPSDCYTHAELRIRVNGLNLPQGGATRLMTDFRSSPSQYTWVHAWAISATYVVPVTGNYTFSLVGQRLSTFSGSGCGMYVGGDGTGQPQASLIALILPPE
ncbi:MAG: hypothetical protein NZZ60_07015 [Bacteroidia bacterium]|nr:hypothetical protein [Bacteroidia bacterium]